VSIARPIYLIRTEEGFIPEFRVDRYEIDRRFPIGARVKATGLTLPRSKKRNGLYWAVLAAVVEATDAVPTPEHLHQIVKLKLGFVTTAVLPSGEVALIPDSTSFEAMSEDENRIFCERAFAWLASTFGLDPVALVKGDADGPATTGTR
jgi:hypothetical protein